MKVSIIGTGHVGLVSGVCLASKGHDVTCVDVNSEIVEKLNRGEATIYEKDLQFLLKKTLSNGKFRATTDLGEALQSSSIAIIAVGTPTEQGKINLKYIKEVSQNLGKYIGSSSNFINVIVKSTVTPGTTIGLVREEMENFSKKKIGQFGLGMNPEFLREGNAVNDFINPDRIVLGYETNKTLAALNELYSAWDIEKLAVNTKTAELIKYANNMLLATQISAVNEIANLANAVGDIDCMDVIKGVHLDKRWNPIINNKRVNPEILEYLIPGCGFGGSCFPKDVNAIKSLGKSLDLEMKIADAILDVNNKQPYQIIKIIENEFDDISGKKILLLGLAFKPGTDDIRESPAIKIVGELINKKAKVSAHDPVAVENFKSHLKLISQKIDFVNDWRENIDQNEIIIITTPWEEYKDLTKIELKDKIIVDAKRSFLPSDFKNSTYRTIGMRVSNDL